MLVLLGSKNPSKKRSLVGALKELGMKGKVLSFEVDSEVRERPMGIEIVEGAKNRNANLKEIALKENIDYDYLCSIEGGAVIEDSGMPYIISYCVLEDRYGRVNIGKSIALSITRELYEYIRDVGSLNRVIERLQNCENYNQKGGITGYLTNGLFDREKIDRDAVMATFMPFVFSDKIEKLENATKERV